MLGEAGLFYAIGKREGAFNSNMLIIEVGCVADLIEALLICFCKEAGACRLRLVIDVAEDGVYILGHILVELTNFSASVDEVRNLL